MKHSGFTVKAFLAAVLLVAVGATAFGTPFERPPEQFAPTWFTSYPYQRNIDWDFATDPEGGPDPNGPPGVHYEGSADDVLKVSDYVDFTGAVAWYATATGSAAGGATYGGVIGIDNRGGGTALTGTAIFHIDNLDTPYIKHLWEEIDFNYELGSITQALVLPAGYNQQAADFGSSWSIGTDPELWRQNIWYEVLPNPPWEEKIFTFTVSPGGFAFIDRFHIATECAIPEPATLMLLGTGLGGLLIARRRRRKH